MDLVEVGWDGLVWSGSGQGQVESSCEFGIELSGSIKCWEAIECHNNYVSRVVLSSIQFVEGSYIGTLLSASRK
jgi:hypothetical protein